MSIDRSTTDDASKGTSTTGHPKKGRLPAWVRRTPLAALVLTIAVLLVTSIAFGATRSNTGRPPPPQTSTPGASPTPGPPTPLVPPAQLAPAPELAELTAQIRRIEQRYRVSLGISIGQVAPYYARTQITWQGGILRDGPALATVDVPMAMAIVAGENQPLDREYVFNRALADDSAAADAALWAFLGDPAEAAERTTELLRAYGDWATRVPAEHPDSPGAPYLYTEWSLDDQAHLMGALACDIDKSFPVLSKLNDPTDQMWGLQTIPLSYSKGAWARLPNGRLLVRQFGLLKLADGTQVAIAMAASSRSEDPSAGRAAITELSNAVRHDAHDFPHRHC